MHRSTLRLGVQTCIEMIYNSYIRLRESKNGVYFYGLAGSIKNFRSYTLRVGSRRTIGRVFICRRPCAPDPSHPARKEYPFSKVVQTNRDEKGSAFQTGLLEWTDTVIYGMLVEDLPHGKLH